MLHTASAGNAHFSFRCFCCQGSTSSKKPVDILWCQSCSLQELLDKDGHFAGQLTNVVETLSFAKQRFDSCASPQAKYVMLLVPIAMLLASQAADDRKDARTRQRCLEALSRMTPEQTILAGLSADFSTEVLRFVRQHDVRNHDIACTTWEKNEFIRRLRGLFLEGRIFTESTAKSDFEEETFTQIAIRNAKSAKPITFGDQVHTLWGPLARDECQGVISSTRAVAQHTLDRIEAEMHPKDLDLAFACFDLKVWSKAKSQLDNGEVSLWRDFEASMKQKVRKLCKAFSLNTIEGEQELVATALSLLEDETGVGECIARNDNRPMWCKVLKGGVTNAELRVLPDLIRIYLCIIDGECGVERDLASLKARSCSGVIENSL